MVHNSYLMTVVPHTRTRAARRQGKVLHRRWDSRHLQSCHLISNSKGAEHILSLISSEVCVCVCVSLTLHTHMQGSFCVCVCVCEYETRGCRFIADRKKQERQTAKRKLSAGQCVSVWSQGKWWKRGQTAQNGTTAPLACSSEVHLFINILMEFCLLRLCLSSFNGAFFFF